MATGLDVAPLVVIVYDTSGSMSYQTGSEPLGPVCTTLAEKDESLTYGFSRDMIAKEVLTGTYQGFWCRQQERPADRYDAGYPIPWYTPEYSGQQGDGVIDENQDRIKFALLTFDTVLAAGEDQTGGWSLGPNAAALSGVGITNLGVQNSTATSGGLIIPPTVEDQTSIRTSNDLVQTAIRGAIPFGGTPIAPALQDTLWLLKNHPRLIKKTPTNDGDPYVNCRKRNVLLITDGKPNLGEDDLGYVTSVKAAESLFKAGVKVYVVGFNLGSDETSIIDEIALAGGTEAAHKATTAQDLASALSVILNKAAPGVHSRTDTVATNITGSSLDLQYQINTAYSVSPVSDYDHRGYFEVTSYRCEEACKDDDSGGAGACELTDVGSLLNARAKARVIYFVLDGKLRPFTKDEVDLTPDLLGVPNDPDVLLQTLVPVKDAGLFNLSGTVIGQSDDPTSRALYRAELIDLFRAESNTRRQKDRLSGIYHSTPVIQTNVSNVDVQIPSFVKYQQSIATRPTIAYTMTTDGFIRAFHVSKPLGGSPDGTEWLEEVWAIAPQHLVTGMHGAAREATFLADGIGVLKDIRLVKSTADISVDDEALLWRSVLVMPDGRGGRGITAVDVTDPFTPFIRWEISNERHCWLDDSSALLKCALPTESDKHDFSRLGHTVGRVRIGTVFITPAGETSLQEVAAAFFPCGDGVVGEPQSGKCFMVVRLDTGEKIKEFRNGNDTVIDKSLAEGNVEDTLDFDIVGDPAVYNTFIGTFVTRAFVGDEGGQLWRLDVASSDPADWTMSFFFDIYHDAKAASHSSPLRSPLKSAPTMSPIPQRGQLVLIFGTGDIDYRPDDEETTWMYSIREKLLVDPTTGLFLSGKVEHEVNWKLELKPGETLTSKSLVFGGVAYFTSYEPATPDACAGGTGRIWGLHYKDAQNDKEPIGKLDEDGDVATATLVTHITLEDSVPYGMSLISRPACSGGSGVGTAAAGGAASVSGGDSALRSSKVGQLELVVQTGSTGQSNTASTPAKGGTTPSVAKFHQRLVRPAKQVISVSWGQVQNL